MNDQKLTLKERLQNLFEKICTNSMMNNAIALIGKTNKVQINEFESLIDVFLGLLKGDLLDKKNQKRNLTIFFSLFIMLKKIEDGRVFNELVLSGIIDNMKKNEDLSVGDFEELKNIFLSLYEENIDKLGFPLQDDFFELLEDGEEACDISYFEKALELLNKKTKECRK